MKTSSTSHARARQPLIRKILVPIDFSDCSLADLRYAVRFDKELGARIIVLYVTDLGPVMMTSGGGEYDSPSYAATSCSLVHAGLLAHSGIGRGLGVGRALAVAVSILKRKVNVAVCFDFCVNDAAHAHTIFARMASFLLCSALCSHPAVTPPMRKFEME